MLVEILTPKKIEFQKEADCVTLPTLSGEISILKDHAPLVSVLAPGKIRIKEKGREISFEIEGGLLKVAKNKVTILLKKF